MTNEATTTVKDEYMPIWVKDKPTVRWQGEKVVVVAGEGRIVNPRFNSKKVWFGVEADEEVEVQVNTIYFPGWRARVDNKPVEINYENKEGVMRVVVPAGKHQVVFWFGETPIRLLANAVSIASVLGLIVWWRKERS
jgi:uncharacterized membrane protein YfhO